MCMRTRDHQIRILLSTFILGFADPQGAWNSLTYISVILGDLVLWKPLSDQMLETWPESSMPPCRHG